MAIKTHSKDIAVIVDPLSFTASIKILSGNIAQTFNKDTDDYEPSRTVIPCVLMPEVSVADTDGLISGIQPITACEWYLGAPKADASNRIAPTDTEFVISESGQPKWSLSVHKDVEPNTPLAIHAIFTIMDTRKRTEVKVERSVTLYTSLYDSKAYNLSIVDQPKNWVIDPLRVIPDASGKWLHTVTAQLYSGKDAVPDANAAYFWQIKDGAEWRDFSADELEICVSGDKTKALTFDARFFRSGAFRCRAAFYETVRPDVPSAMLEALTSFKVEFPKTLRANVKQTAGARVKPDLSTMCRYECILSDTTGILDVRNELVDITWKGASGKPGVGHKVIGKGKTISFTPSSLGFDNNFSMSVYAEVKLHAVRALVTQNNKVVVNGGKAVTMVKYE